MHARWLYLGREKVLLIREVLLYDFVVDVL